MRRVVVGILLLASPALAQSNLAPKKNTTSRADNCAPIGRTADGKLVYSLKCDNLPAPPQPPHAEMQQAPVAAEPEVERGGLFGWSYTRKNPNE